MNLPQGKRGQMLAVALLLIPLLLLYRLALLPAWESYSRLSQDIEDGQEQLARYRRIAAQLPQLEAAQQQLAGTQTLAPYLLQGNNQSLAAAGLQQHLQTLVRQHGGRILSLRNLKPETEDALQMIPLEVRFQVSVDGLRQIIYQLESGKQTLRLENVNITSRRVQTRARNRRQRSMINDQIDVRLTLSGLRAAERETSGG